MLLPPLERGHTWRAVRPPESATELLLYVVVDVVCRIWLVDKKCYIPLHSLECNRRFRGASVAPPRMAGGADLTSSQFLVSCMRHATV